MECANICMSNSAKYFKEMMQNIQKEGFKEAVFLCEFIKPFLNKKNNKNLDFDSFIKIGVQDMNGKVEYY